MLIPSEPFSLMSRVYRKILPEVHRELAVWKKKAEAIPDEELRKQALASIEHKTFHCEGGSILAIMAKDQYKAAIRFIVAYQTISDYLDNLCDRSTSLDPQDFAALHEAMEDSLNIHAEPRDYYRFRQERNDGGYLAELTATCRDVLKSTKHYGHIQAYLLELCRYYSDLQIHKHVVVEERVPRLKKWFAEYKDEIPEMEWYEFSACSGSTLGIFCLVSYAMREDFSKEQAKNIKEGYFPYIQGLHILLDYLIDQEEDRLGGDLNFCFYYNDSEEMFNRLKHFISEADRHTNQLPHKRFHMLINRGLIGIYLSDEKVRQQEAVRRLSRNMIRAGGLISYFFYINGRFYRKVQKWVPTSFIKVFFK